MIFANGKSIAPTIAVGKPTGTLNIDSNGIYDVAAYAEVNVKLATQSIPVGYYQPTYTSTDGYTYSGSASDVTTRLYEIVEIGDTYIQCLSTNVYTKAMSAIEIGYLDLNKNFTAIATGSRTSADIDVTFDGSAPNEAVVILKNLDDNTLYVMCRYASSTQTVALSTSSSNVNVSGYSRENSSRIDLSKLPSETAGTTTVSSSPQSKHPAFIFTSAGMYCGTGTIGYYST